LVAQIIKNSDDKKIAQMIRAASTLQIFWTESRSLFIEKPERFEPSNLADTVQPLPAAYSQLRLVGDGVKVRQVSSSELQCGIPGEHSRSSKAF